MIICLPFYRKMSDFLCFNANVYTYCHFSLPTFLTELCYHFTFLCTTAAAVYSSGIRFVKALSKKRVTFIWNIIYIMTVFEQLFIRHFILFLHFHLSMSTIILFDN
jgi:hypothetical protein